MSSRATAASDNVVTTQSGDLKGRREGAVVVFRGIPYAEPPVGALRFRTPRPAKPWKGTRDAFEFGPASIQELAWGRGYPFGPIVAMNEDCLTLNVWAPVDAANRPVIVWIHGGGYRMGSSSMPAYDGRNFAAVGQVVMVSINYRLGVLGFAAHLDLRDPETGAFANWAIQDQILALRWVKENIAAFGGDPDRVTVMGESGGAINAIMLAHGAAGKSLFQQIIAMSPPYICPPATLAIDDWAISLQALAKELRTTVAGLREVPATTLHDAEMRQYLQGALKTDTGRSYRGTVADGIVLDDWPAFYALPRIPMIIGCTAAEGAMGYNCYHPISKELLSRSRPADDAAARMEAQSLLNRNYYLTDRTSGADGVLAHYRECARAEGRSDDRIAMLVELFGDAMIRHYCVRKAEQITRAGHKNVYFYHYDLPVPSPNHEPPHAWELPIAFGNHRNPLIAPWVGNGPLHDSVSNAMIDSFSNFAAAGHPQSSLLPSWPAFHPRGANVMVLGAAGVPGKVTSLPKYRQLSVLDELAALRPS
jgi:para-nitrobenzyl esterase